MTLSDLVPEHPAEEYALLAAIFAEAPPTDLRARALHVDRRHLLARTAIDAISPVEAVSRAVDDIAALLTDLSDDEWDLHALDGLSVKELVGHLTGGDRYLGTSIGAWDGDYRALEHDHRATTQRDIDEAATSSARATHAQWSSISGALIDHLSGLDADALGEPARFNEIDGDLAAVLIARTFELWTHAEDICRATSRDIVLPDVGRLGLMAATAATVIPLGVQRAGGDDLDHTVRLVLTGLGGGTWDCALGTAPVGDVDVVVITDVVNFCRLMARRIDPHDFACEMFGDLPLGERVLVGATQFAMD